MKKKTKKTNKQKTKTNKTLELLATLQVQVEVCLTIILAKLQLA